LLVEDGVAVRALAVPCAALLLAGSRIRPTFLI